MLTFLLHGPHGLHEVQTVTELPPLKSQDISNVCGGGGVCVVQTETGFHTWPCRTDRHQLCPYPVLSLSFQHGFLCCLSHSILAMCIYGL